MSIQQSGNVTPNHLVVWTTDGVVQDGGSPVAAGRILGSIRAADFNDTGDQPIYLPVGVTAFQILGITATNANQNMTTASGGVYPNAGKTGTQIVSSGQTFVLLTTPTILLPLTISAPGLATRFSSSNVDVVAINGINRLAIYLALTVGQGLNATADIYLYGLDLSP